MLIDINAAAPPKFNGVERMPEIVTVDIEQMNSIGAQYYLQGDFPRAEECFLAIVRADPQHSMAWSNLGLIWQMTGHFDDALKAYMEAFRLDPNNGATLANLAHLYDAMGFLAHSERFCERAIELEPTNVRAKVNLGFALLKRHEYARAWPLLEERFNTIPRNAIMREFGLPWWDGKPCEKLAIWPEQGVGDQVLYMTLLPELIARGQDFVCEIDERLIPALQRSFPDQEFVPSAEEAHINYDRAAFAGCEAHISMASLPGLFRRSIEDFEAQPRMRILTADGHRSLFLREKMAPVSKRVAISWRSFHNALGLSKQTQKSARLADFKALGQRSDVELVTVQYGDVANELAAWEWNYIHRPHGVDMFSDIDGVLAAIAACDAVVTTSNVTAHFAGALGVKCYLIYLRAISPFFYWTPDQNGNSLWYPSVEIVTGEGINTWEKAIALVNERL